MESQRRQQVAELVRSYVARILREEVDDPLIGFVTLTDSEISPDLRHARIYFSVLAERDSPEEALKGLKRASKYIRRRIAEEAGLRVTPSLQFVYDATAERAQRIEALLKQIADERPDDEPAPSEAPEDE